MASSDSQSAFFGSDSDAGRPYFIGLCHQLFTIPGSAMYNSQRYQGFCEGFFCHLWHKQCRQGSRHRFCLLSRINSITGQVCGRKSYRHHAAYEPPKEDVDIVYLKQCLLPAIESSMEKPLVGTFSWTWRNCLPLPWAAYAPLSVEKLLDHHCLWILQLLWPCWDSCRTAC